MVVLGDIDSAYDGRPERISWKESNLASIGSDLDHKMKQAAARREGAWDGVVGITTTTPQQRLPVLWIWRIEDFTPVLWPEQDYGCFYSGDSYVIVHGWAEVDTPDKVKYDIYIWIGSTSSQDEYGTAAYKMVELDEVIGGTAIQHREVEGKESKKFVKLFGKDNEDDVNGTVLTYWQGGVASGFRHVEPTEEKPILFRIKGSSSSTMSLKQLPVKKSSLTGGDSFVLKVSEEKVWLWNGKNANPQEKHRAIGVADRLCTKGTVMVLDQGDGDDDDPETDFWAYFNDTNSDIGPPADDDQDDVVVDEFAPLLFKLKNGPGGNDGYDDEGDDFDDDFDNHNEPEQVGKGETVKLGNGVTDSRLDRSLLDDSDVFLLDAGWEIFVWIGKDADRSEKLGAVTKADAYTQGDLRTIELPVQFVKSGMEPSDFLQYFAK